MQVEHETRIIKIDKDFDAELEKMKAEGWRNMPGFWPVAIFPVYRDENTIAESANAAAVQQAGFGGVMGGHIADDKVGIIRAGSSIVEFPNSKDGTAS